MLGLAPRGVRAAPGACGDRKQETGLSGLDVKVILTKRLLQLSSSSTLFSVLRGVLEARLLRLERGLPHEDARLRLLEATSSSLSGSNASSSSSLPSSSFLVGTKSSSSSPLSEFPSGRFSRRFLVRRTDGERPAAAAAGPRPRDRD